MVHVKYFPENKYFSKMLFLAIDTACHQLDVPRPIILPRHERDWEQFSQARFLKEHFIEDVPFDRMEVEFIDPDKKKRNNPAYY